MSLSLNYPTISPSLLLDFVNSNRVDPLVTFTRSSAATYFDETGTLQTAGNNVPRIDFDPSTLVCRGLLIEEQRTNSIRNNTMQGAVAGTPGTNPTNWSAASSASGITKEIVGTGTEGGITYIDIRYSGTSTSSGTVQINPETTTGVAALTGQTWTASNYLKLAGGSFPGVLSIIWQERDSGGVSVSTSSVLISSPTTAALNTQRYSNTRTLSGGASVAYVTARIDVSIPNATAVDFTLRIGLPQLELGVFATSVIPTTSTAVTRGADVASVNTLSPWFNSASGTIYAEYQPISATASQLAVAFIDTGTGSANRATVGLSSAGTSYSAAMVDSSSVQANLTQGTFSTSAVKNAFAFALNDFAFSVNGASPAVDTLGTVSSAFTLMQLGSRGGSFPLNGYLQRITYYPVRLPNAQLQALTA